MPEFLKYQDKEILKTLYDDILYRDIVARYEIKEIKTLRDLSLYLLSHIGTPFSYKRLKEMLDVGSVNTIRSYIHYLENTYLLFTVPCFSFSFRKQIAAQKKIYVIDNGLVNFISFKFSEQRGRLLENLVFLELKRRGKNIYYHKTSEGGEVDFLIQEGARVSELIQVTSQWRGEDLKKRETQALMSAMEEFNLKEGLILTEEDETVLKENGKTIRLVPVYKWLLGN